ncbi:MAG: ABC transporter permease [Nitrososphaerota archaeon]
MFSSLKLLTTISIIFLFVFFYIPLIGMFIYSLKSENPIENYVSILKNPLYIRIIGYSLLISFLTTIISLLISYPIAYYLAFIVNEKFKSIILIAFIAPFWVNFLLRTYALYNVLYMIGIINNFIALLIGMVYDYYPYMLLSIYAALSKISKSILDASFLFGASPFQRFTKIILPLSTPGIIAGSIFVSLTTMTEFVVPSMLGGIEGYTVGYLIWDLFLKYRNWFKGSALSIIIIFIALIISLFYSRKAKVVLI